MTNRDQYIFNQFIMNKNRTVKAKINQD